MTETGERIAATCPGCSPGTPTAHEVLKPGGQSTVRCTECGHVHKTAVEDETTVERRVVVSQEGESFEARVDAPPDERVAVGEEFLLETDVGVFTVRITSLELDEERVESAQVEDVRTFWTRAVGNVAVNLTLHPADGAHDETESLTLRVPGGQKFVVGESYEFGDNEFTVEGVHVRDDATGYEFEKLDHPGDSVVAKDVNRLYARDETTTAWSAW